MTSLKEKKSACNSTHNCNEPQAKSCSSSRLMAFVIPFTVITASNALCHQNCMLVSSTMGLLAGAAGFGLYSLIKSTLRKMRASKPSANQELRPVMRAVNFEEVLVD
jgi:hypothetical protein